MITKSNIGSILIAEPFNFQEVRGTYIQHYGTSDEGFDLSYNFKAGTFDYPNGVEADRSTTQDSHQKESFVVFLCVAQLFSIGYQPKHIKLEGKNYSGTDKGYCDILVKNNDGEEYLIIECKTAEFAKKDDEFRKHWAKTMRNGDQLFRYFNTYRKAKYLCMLAADFPEYKKEDGTKGNKFEFIYHLISLVDNDDYLKTDESFRSFRSLREEQGGSEDFFKVWKQTYKQDYSTRGLLERGIEPFNVGKKNYNLADLDTINEYSLNKKYNEFAIILRKHTISSHENAFDKLVNLFLSKIIDERYHGKELTFLWKGAAYDDYFSLQDRLNILYRKGMKDFFGDEVTYVENEQIDAAFAFLTSKADEGKETIKRYFRQLKYFNNNPFAFLDVHNEQLFFQNSSILKDVISMLQGIYLTKQTDNQFLGDLFEGFLNKGIHQSEGQFFSPIPIVRFLMSSLPLNKIIKQNKSIPRVIDYACGSGHFLTEYARQIQKIVDKDEVEQYYKQIIGIEKDYRLSKVSQVAAFMYGMDGIRIHFSDALVDVPEVKEHSFDILVANPPYSVSGFLETLTEEERLRYTLTQYVSNPEKNNSIETFFIERASQLLAPGGVASIILPSSILTKGNLYMKTRELLMRDFDIVAICCFGKNTFGQTSTNTVTLFLRRKAIEPNMSKHLLNRIDSWFVGNMNDDDFYRDSHLLDAYIEKNGYLREDYIAMIKGELTESFLRTEMAQDYIKALNVPKIGNNSAATALALGARKVREEAQKYVVSRAYRELTTEGKKNEIENFRVKFIQEIEKEKLYYFTLSACNPQPVIVVTSPENKGKKDRKEQEFLGYEWSNRKGAEGIHYLNTGVIKESLQDDEDADDDTISQLLSVDDICTPLFNPKEYNDESKINWLIRKNFENNENVEIPDELDDYVKMYNLVDLLTFSNVEFDKIINTTPELSYPKYETRYSTMPIKDVAPYVKDKTLLSEIEVKTYVSTENMLADRKGVEAYEGIPQIKKVTAYKKGDILVSNIRPYLKKIWLANSDGGCSNDVLVFRNTLSSEISNDYLYYILSSDLFFEYMMVGNTGVKMPRGNKKAIQKFEVPVPPINIQHQIVKECIVIDELQKENTYIVEKGLQEIRFLVSSLKGEKNKISKVCDINAITINPNNNPNKEYVYIDIDAVENGSGKISWKKIIKGSKAPSRARRYAISGSTLISTVRPNLRGFAFIAEENLDAVYSTGFAVLKSKDQLILPDKMLYYQFMYSDLMMQQMIAAMPQSSYPSINRKDIDEFDVLVSISNQDSILEDLNRIENRINAANDILSQLLQRKQAVLDKYLK